MRPPKNIDLNKPLDSQLAGHYLEGMRASQLPSPPPSPPTRKIKEGTNRPSRRVLLDLFRVALDIGIYGGLIVILMMIVFSPFWYLLVITGFILLPALIFALRETCDPALTLEKERPPEEVKGHDIALDAAIWLNAKAKNFGEAAATKAKTLDNRLRKLFVLLEDQNDTPAAKEAIDLLRNELPQLVAFYNNVPVEYRHKSNLGHTPEDVMCSGLEAIGNKMDDLIDQLKQRRIDDLAIMSRKLEYAHGRS